MRHTWANVRIIAVRHLASIYRSRASVRLYARAVTRVAAVSTAFNRPEPPVPSPFRGTGSASSRYRLTSASSARPHSRRGIGGLRLHPWRVTSLGARCSSNASQHPNEPRHDAKTLPSLIWFSNNAPSAEGEEASPALNAKSSSRQTRNRQGGDSSRFLPRVVYQRGNASAAIRATYTANIYLRVREASAVNFRKAACRPPPSYVRGDFTGSIRISGGPRRQRWRLTVYINSAALDKFASVASRKVVRALDASPALVGRAARLRAAP